MNSEKILRLYAATQESSYHSIKLYCFLCKKRTCCHALQEVAKDSLSNHFEFDFDNEFLEDSCDITPTVELISSKNYPCKLLIIF